MGALYKGFITTGVLSLIGLRRVISLADRLRTPCRDTLHRLGSVFLRRRRPRRDGALVWITEYYTGTNYRPVQSIAAGLATGHGTNVIQGLAVSLESTALPALVISPASS